MIQICAQCWAHLDSKNPPKPPKFALANGLWTGRLPAVLRLPENQPTEGEMMLMTPLVTFIHIVTLTKRGKKRLKIDDPHEDKTAQKALLGHGITFPTDHTSLCRKLPRRPADVANQYMKVLFASHDKPTRKDLQRLYSVRPRVLRLWLYHLHQHHAHWRNEKIEIDEEALNELPAETEANPFPVPPAFEDMVQHITERSARRTPKPLRSSKYAESDDDDDDDDDEPISEAKTSDGKVDAVASAPSSAASGSSSVPSVKPAGAAVPMAVDDEVVDMTARAPKAIPLRGPPPMPAAQPRVPMSVDDSLASGKDRQPPSVAAKQPASASDREPEMVPMLYSSAMLDQHANALPSRSMASLLLPNDVEAEKADMKVANPIIEDEAVIDEKGVAEPVLGIDTRCNAFVSVRGSTPIVQTRDKYWWTLAFWRLFFFGINGPASDRPVHLSVQEWAQWAMEVHDDRFAKDRTFMAVLFSYIRRLQSYRATRGRVNMKDWGQVEASIMDIDEGVLRDYKLNQADLAELRRKNRFRGKAGMDDAYQKLQDFANKIAPSLGPGAARLNVKRDGQPLSIDGAINTLHDKFAIIEKLLHTGKSCATRLPGSDDSRTALRRDINGMELEFGLPGFFYTLSPGEVYHRL